MESVSYVVGHYCAPNDKNGNPRRVFVLYRLNPFSSGMAAVAAANEGYNGDNPDIVRGMFAAHLQGKYVLKFAPRVHVPAAEYRRLLRAGSVHAPTYVAAPTRLDERD